MYNPPFAISPESMKLLSNICEKQKIHITEQPELSLQLGDILAAHAAMGGEARFRQSPPTPHWAPVLTNALLQWVNTSPTHPLIRAAVFHYELVHIRPFEAGNRKVAEYIAQVIRRTVISECSFTLDPDMYNRAMAVTDASEYIHASLQAILAALQQRTAKAKPETTHRRQSSPLEQLLHYLRRHPGSKRQDIMAALPALSARMLDRHLQTLRASGQIEYRGSRKTGAYYPGNN